MAPVNIVASGTRIISTFVFPVINFPISIPIKLTINAPIGSPGPLSTISPPVKTVPAKILLAKLPIVPAIAEDTVTYGLALYLLATPIPIPAPVKLAAILPIVISIPPIQPGSNFPICSIIVPIIKVENNPQAIPVNPSIHT